MNYTYDICYDRHDWPWPYVARVYRPGDVWPFTLDLHVAFTKAGARRWAKRRIAKEPRVRAERNVIESGYVAA